MSRIAFRDILKLREMVRKNFLMYYAQENLFDLKARQVAEDRLMDDVEYFARVSVYLLLQFDTSTVESTPMVNA